MVAKRKIPLALDCLAALDSWPPSEWFPRAPSYLGRAVLFTRRTLFCGAGVGVAGCGIAGERGGGFVSARRYAPYLAGAA
jgi:hypothetical protein